MTSSFLIAAAFVQPLAASKQAALVVACHDTLNYNELRCIECGFYVYDLEKSS